MKDFWILEEIIRRANQHNGIINDLKSSTIKTFRQSGYLTKYNVLTEKGRKKYNEEKIKSDHY